MRIPRNVKMAKSLSDDQLDDLVDDAEDFGEGIPGDDDPSEGQATASEEDSQEDIEPEEIEEPAPSFRDILSKRGVTVPDDADEIEYFNGMLDQFTRLNQQVQAERQQYQQQLAYYQQLSQQQPQKPLQEPVKPAELKGLLSHWKAVPEWQDTWLQLVKRNEAGEVIPIPGAAPDLPQKIRERQLWEERAQRLFFENPQQFIYEALENHPSFQEIRQFQTQSQQDFLAYQDKMESDRIAREREPHLIQYDNQGNKHLTLAGQAYVAAIQEATAESKGTITDSKLLDKIGWRAALPYAIQAQEQAQKPVETASEAKKKRQLSFARKQAEKKPGRSSESQRAKAKDRPRDAVDLQKAMIAGLVEAGIDPDARI